MTACAEWLWSEYPLRHPELKIALSEGGIGWVAMLLDRLDYIVDHSSYGDGWPERPSHVLQRNFWFCTLEDRSTIDTRHRIGVDHIMVEVDYPHGDTTWPDTQAVIGANWGHIPAPELPRCVARTPRPSTATRSPTWCSLATDAPTVCSVSALQRRNHANRRALSSCRCRGAARGPGAPRSSTPWATISSPATNTESMPIAPP